MQLQGAFLPVTTPFDPTTGDVDVDAFRANLARWFEHPLAGVLVGGSTGESVFLEEDETAALLAAAEEALPVDATIIAGTGAESTRTAIRWAKEAAAGGADAVLVSPPAYYRTAMTPEVLVRHYTAVADASPVPVIIYQVPLRMSTLDLPTGLLVELSHHDNIVGIKDSRGKLELVGELVEACADDFQVLVGSGALLDGALGVGAAGGIVAVGLMATAEAAEIYQAFTEGDTARSGQIQERIAPVHNQIVGGMGVPGIKRALDLLGYRGGEPRPPLAPLAPGREDEIRDILAGAGLLEGAPAV